MKRHSLAQIVKTATEIYKIPSVNSCNLELIGTDKISVETEYSQLDLDRNEQTKFIKRHLFQVVQEDEKATVNLLDSSRPIALRADSMRVKSRNSHYQVSITNWKDKNDEKQYLEIWNGENRIENINLTKIGKHDKFYEGTLVWSLDSTKLAYIAEAKKTRKISSFFTVSVEEEAKLDETNHEEKYSNVFSDSWGEQNIDKVKSIIAIFDLKSLELNVIDNLPNDVCPSSLAWYRNDGIVFTGLHTQPYKLGLIYCPTRKSELYYYDLNGGKCVQLTKTNESVRSPRFSNDFKYLCWLQNPVNGPHFPCSKLMLMSWSVEENPSVDILIDIVKEEGSSKEGFNGIFSLNLPNKCWSLDSKRIVFSSQTGHNVRVFSCDVDSKIVSVLDNNLPDASSCEVLYFDENDWICASFQSYNRRPTIALAKLPSRGNENQVEWNIINEEKEESIIKINPIRFTPDYENKKFPNVKFEAMLIHQNNEKNDCLVVFPHGGPHGAFSGEFSPHVAIMVYLGYSVLLVNYRGSTGYGQNGIDSLPGDIGSQDVKDMQQAAEYCFKEFNFKKSFAYGGSHGGFLSAHLVGQYPDFYSAAAIRNPVIQLEAMRNSSDIPDWVITETFGNYDFDFKNSPVDRESYEELINKSPIRYIDNVKAPVLIMIGSVDLRVPALQGKEFYKGLISRGKTARLLVYKEDNHPLSKPQTTADCIVNTILWFEKY